MSKANYENISPSQLATRLQKVLREYGQEIDKGVDTKAKKAMKELVARTKKDAPYNAHSGRHYRDQISSKTFTSETGKHSYLWYINGDDYRLAHLLNNGHQLRNGGRYPGDRHVTRNAEIVMDQYWEEVKEMISSGSQDGA